jgi:hypothetical protein
MVKGIPSSSARAGSRQARVRSPDAGLHAVGEEHAEQGQLGELPDHRGVGAEW